MTGYQEKNANHRQMHIVMRTVAEHYFLPSVNVQQIVNVNCGQIKRPVQSTFDLRSGFQNYIDYS